MNDMAYEERVKARDEARILEALNHPNIILFKDVFKDSRMNLNVVMEYADGGELADEIKRRKNSGQTFSEEEILSYFTQICLALKHCHDRKILHRDLKPQNIFMTRTGICKLGDFGISKVLNGTKSKAQSTVGTPLYLSPELLSGQPYDHKTDIWSMGILLYELAALRVPWRSTSLSQIGHEIVNNKYPALPDQYSFALKNLVMQCLQKTPS